MSDPKPRHTQHLPGAEEPFQEYLEALGEKTVLDTKTRALLLTALACTLQCPACTQLHVREALNAGASREEVAEALLIAALEGARAQTDWTEKDKTEHPGED